MSFADGNPINPPEAVNNLLKDIDTWEFDVFELNRLGENHALRYVGYELLRTTGLISKLRVSLW